MFSLVIYFIHSIYNMGEGNGNPLQSLPGESHGQRSLEGCQGSDMAEHTHINNIYAYVNPNLGIHPTHLLLSLGFIFLLSVTMGPA